MSEIEITTTANSENNNDNTEKVEETEPSPVGDSKCDMQEVNNASRDESEADLSNTKEINTSENQDKKSPLKRNVKFFGDKPVSGYLEPPDPWKNAPSWTSADLINSYKESCKKHNTRPIPTILNQLQGIENVGERYAILSLKGEKLDMKNVETLEEIFKFVQFQCVDLEGTHLDEETSVAIFEMIEYYESACKVNVSFNKGISIRGWQSCAKMVRKTPALTFLDARSCDINERSLPIMGRALRMGCFLKILHLENTYLSGRSLVILVAAIKMNDILKELFLADNKLMPTDGIQIGSLLKYNHVLELLDLRNNPLQDIGITHVSDGLYEQNLDQGLNTLVLWNNQLTYQGMASIAKALTSTQCLETLNLGHNNITNEGIHQMKEGLLQNKSLLRLGLQGTKVTCEGAVALAEVIADSQNFLRIDLRENEIKTAGLMALSLSLKVNDILHRLDLDKDLKKETGIKDYADQQKRLLQDINKKLEDNREMFYKLEREKNLEKAKQAKEHDDEESEMTYFEHCDKVRRPSLLYMPDCPREVTLDSPRCTEEPVDYIPFSAPNSVITTPPGELLLSPQFCPSVKARKIFTVTKCAPHPSGLSIPSIRPPVGEHPIALSSSTPVLPLQPVLINSSSEIPNNSDIMNSDGDKITITSIPKIEPLTVSDVTHALVNESVNQFLNQIICDDSTKTGSTKDSNVSESTDTKLSTVSVVTPDMDANGDHSEINVQSNNDENPLPKNSDSEEKSNKNDIQNSELSNVVINNRQLELIANRETDSGVGSYDSEQWTNVEDAVVKPNFQTSLTLNGLTQELANAIEGLEVVPDNSQSSCNGLTEELASTMDGLNVPANHSEGDVSPDDFERELDEMLANVKMTSNTIPGFLNIYLVEMPLFEALSYSSDKNVVILDIGAVYTKCGLAGETGPRCIIPSVVKNEKNEKIVKIWEFSSTEELYENLKNFLFQLFFRSLLVNAKDRRLVVCESILCPSQVRETLAKVLFIHFEVSSVMFGAGHLLSMLTLGTNTGLVIDLGYSETVVVPVYEGIPVIKALQAIPVAGKAVHRKIEDLLKDTAKITEDGEDKPVSEVPECLTEELLEDIKVRCCFVTNLKRAKEIHEVTMKGESKDQLPTPPPSVEYPLDGGKILHISGEIREHSCEVLFEQDNEEVSVSTLILDAIIQCPIDMRKVLSENIVIIGGTSMLAGFHHRLRAELYDLLEKPKYKDSLAIKEFRFHQMPAKQNYAAWLGGAMMGALETLPSKSVTRDLYIINGHLTDWCSISSEKQ
ncbi:protein phosphatase 1 regulatory subunit 37-like [Mytilus edulis]|uniref:protein phosphatase 1 regulatory subunit 37-like n=1 Tax=Mytilus edulis TaxID=6550 RepID=UPI0039EE74BA